jgi:endonuclease-8
VPEGDTVWLSCRTLDRALAGRTVVRSDLRVPQLATIDLSGRTVIDVVPRGKHLLMRFDHGMTLHSHLRMDGSWDLYRAGARWRGGSGHLIRAVIDCGTVLAVGYHLHDLALVAAEDEHTLVGHLGPDLLDPSFDLDEALHRLTADPGAEIGPALLEQRHLAGIGNLYKNEVLFLERLTPWVRVGDVPDPRRLVERARTLLEVNKERFEQITTADPRPGHHTWVFERRGLPCRRCGTLIDCRTQDPFARLSYWCPSCQKGPSPSLQSEGRTRGIQRR